MKKLLSVVTIAVIVSASLTSCVTKTNVIFDSDPRGAEVYIDGRSIGETPTSKKLSNSIAKDPRVVVELDGYRSVYTRLEKEIKPVNLVAGLIIWWPSLFWCYGPEPDQFYRMIEE